MSDVRRDSTCVSSCSDMLSWGSFLLLTSTDLVLACSSFGDPNAQPPTPQLTPTPASFSSPVFETPRPPNGSFTDLGGSTPRFAEEYSVFNATPGNLRGSHGQFPDFAPSTPAASHKRLLSAEGLALEIATHANHFSPNPNLPPLDPSQRLASSPSLNSSSQASARDTTPAASPSLAKPRSAKKLRRGTITKDQESHIISPPPTAHKGAHKLAPKLTMQYEQSFHQPDFADGSQPHDVTALMANPADMFSYPLSAPAGAPSNFWDPQNSMGMELDFSAASQGMFPSPMPGHRHTGSFDWNNNIQLFQDASMPPPAASNQDTMHPHQQGSGMMVNPAGYPPQLGDPFDMMTAGGLVDPGLMLGQPDGTMADFVGLEQNMPAPVKAPVAASKGKAPANARRTANNKSARATKVQAPDRTLASSPLKHSRAGLDQVAGDSHVRGTLVRSHTLPTLAPAPTARSMAEVAGGSVAVESSRPMARPNGRISPVKSQRRLSSLASIRESSPARQRASVRFTIDSRGRARAETLMMGQDGMSQGLTRSQSSKDLWYHASREASPDIESEDDDPIIMPSRNNSFCASFALPDPRKPIGSIFHRPRRSTSDRSSSSAGGENGNHNGHDSDPETHEQRGRSGDAASELAKLVESRQKRFSQPANMPGRLVTNLGHFQSDTISPSSLAESGYGTDGQGVRCVCKRTGTGADGKSFMVQW